MNKRLKKLEDELEKLGWKLGWRTKLTFQECKNGVLYANHEFLIDELVRLILDYLNVEPRNVPSKDILIQSKNVLKKKKEKK